MKVPCELVVWHALPAFRKEIARSLVEDMHLNQRMAAEKLGITEAAVSQYFKNKRGSDMKFSKELKNEIRKAAKEIATSKKEYVVIQQICALCYMFRSRMLLCKFHKIDDKKPKGCKVCEEVCK
ncbi:MAG: transcriptional regulator [Candidatus Woesearchaeota archaeon]|nr:transcriptional regulator [Candidatus Woesearchaeota archaeon]